MTGRHRRRAGRALFQSVAGCLAVLALAGCSRREPPPPNIVLVVLDTARADRFSSYGYAKPTTPVVDALARDGMRFANAFSTAPWTLPSHASLFTGLFSHQHGTTCESWKLKAEHITLAERLRERGYQTVAFSVNPWVSKGMGFGQGFDRFEEVWRRIDLTAPAAGARLTADLVRLWREQAHDRERPYFLFLNLLEPHLNYNPPEPHRTRMLPADHAPEMVERLRAIGHPFEVGYIFGKVEVTAEELAIFSALYDGEMAAVDEQLGRLLGYLRADGGLDNTVIVITSDHGENIGEHQMMDHKFCVYDTLLHIPLIISWPGGGLPKGAVVDGQVQLSDVYATLLDAAGLTTDLASSKSLLPSGGVLPEGRRWVGAEFGRPLEFLKTVEGTWDDLDTTLFDRRLKTIRSTDWKYIWSSDGSSELYHIRDDPGELNNLIDAKPEQRQRLHHALEEWLGQPLPTAKAIRP